MVSCNGLHYFHSKIVLIVSHVVKLWLSILGARLMQFFFPSVSEVKKPAEKFQKLCLLYLTHLNNDSHSEGGLKQYKIEIIQYLQTISNKQDVLAFLRCEHRYHLNQYAKTNADLLNLSGATSEILMLYWFLILITFPISIPLLILWSFLTRGTPNFLKSDGAIFVDAIINLLEKSPDDTILRGGPDHDVSDVSDVSVTHPIPGPMCTNTLANVNSKETPPIIHPDAVIPMPMFDTDDLSFFRVMGLSLRHVELELGKKEIKDGATRGDAVSLACYGLEHPPRVCTTEICAQFQINVEKFILSSYDNFHEAYYHYNDAAFLVLDRGGDARAPYDFYKYPLGKCGSIGFSVRQIILMITSEYDINEDINDAVYNTMMHLKNELRQLKIQQFNALLNKLNDAQFIAEEQKEVLQDIITTVTSHVQSNTFLNADFFAELHRLVDYASMSDDILDELSTLQQKTAEINSTIKKSDDTCYVSHQFMDFDALTMTELKEKLMHYIQYQNLGKVEQCFERFLPNTLTDFEVAHCLQIASSLPNTAILQAVNNYNPSVYLSDFFSIRWRSPIYCSAEKINLKNIQFLLDLKPFSVSDLGLQFNEHILYGIQSKGTEESFHVVKTLIDAGATIGNERTGLHENPLARYVGSDGTYIEKILEYMLPLADYRSKYAGIISATYELFYHYGHCKRQDHHVEDDDYCMRLLRKRTVILQSLTEKECTNIAALYSKRYYHETIGGKGEEILEDEMLNYELISARTTGDHHLAEIIARCFGKKSIQLSDQKITMFAERPDFVIAETESSVSTDCRSQQAPTSTV